MLFSIIPNYYMKKSIVKVYFSLQMLLLFFVFPESYFTS